MTEKEIVSKYGSTFPQYSQKKINDLSHYATFQFEHYGHFGKIHIPLFHGGMLCVYNGQSVTHRDCEDWFSNIIMHFKITK